MFIKDYSNVSDPDVRAKHGLLGASIGLVTNSILVLMKVGVAIYLSSLTGFSVFSVALIGDAINNLGDVANSFVTLFSFKVSARPADKEHPYGHQRSEYVAGLAVSIIICCLAAVLLEESITSIVSSTQVTYDLVAIIVLAIGILIKLFQAYVYRGLYKAIGSLALKASAFDALSDVAATGLVLASALVSYLAGINDLDAYMGALLALFILFAGLKMAKEAISPLLGNPISQKEAEEITKAVLQEEAILGVHDLIVYDYGPSRKYLTLHAEIDERVSLKEGHSYVDKAEKRLKELGYEATIHLDPVEVGDPRLDSLKSDIEKAIASISSKASYHDIRLEGGRLSMDILLPFEETDKKADIEKAIKMALDKRKDGPIEPALSFDTPYIEE